MAQLFVDSFSIYATADLPTRWAGGATPQAAINSTVPMAPPGAQTGWSVLDLTNSGATVLSQNYGSLSRWIIAAQVYRKNSGSSGALFSLLDNLGGGNVGASVILQATPAATLITKGDGTVLGSGPIIPYHEWHQLECDFTLSTTGGGILKVYLDGNPTPFISATGVSTQYAVAQQYALGEVPQTVNANINTDQDWYSSHYAFSATGAVPMFNSALAPQGLGNAIMAFGVANAPGVVSAWTPNGAGTIWQSINQIPQDGDTTYASSNTPGQVYMCPFNTLPAQSAVVSVQLSTYARQDGAGPRAIQTGFYNGGSYGFSGADIYLSASYNYFEDEYMVDPITGLAWTPASLLAMQYGANLEV